AVAGENSHETELWDLETGRRVQFLRGHLGSVVALAFSRDGKRLATSDFEGHARVWDALTGEEVLTLRNDRGARGDLAFTEDGRLVRTTSHDGRVKVWDAMPLSPSIEAEEEAASLVTRLIRQVMVKAEVIDRIRAEPSLRESVRRAALEIAERYREDPGLLD